MSTISARAAATREKLVRTASALIRRQGFVFTTVDQICEAAGVTKGAFFHHFASKDDLADACLGQWDTGAAAMESKAPFLTLADPRDRAIGYMDFYIGVFSDPNVIKSCLAGTTAQEVADTNPRLRDAANACFAHAGARLKTLLDEACAGATAEFDTQTLASVWLASVQGALILYKASQDAAALRATLEQVKSHIAAHFPPRRHASARRPGKQPARSR